MNIYRSGVITGLIFVATALAPCAHADWDEGDNPWLDKTLKKTTIDHAVAAAADYLVRNQLPDGQFVYIKDPLGKATAKGKRDRYSLIRHLGAAYALLRAYETTQKPLYLEHAAQAIDFAARFAKHRGKTATIKGIKRKVDIGENGFALIVTSLYDHLTNSKRYRKLSDGLVRFLLRALRYDGPYSTPGQWAECQAVIGLVHYYQHQKPLPRIVTVTRKWLEGVREDDNVSHWTVQAYWGFSRIDPDQGKAFTKFALASGKSLLDGVLDGEDTDQPRLVGTKGRLGSCAVTARNEGLLAALNLARHSGRQRFARRLERHVRNHLAHALMYQYGLPGNMYASHKRLRRVGELFDLRGGVFNKPEEAFVRIDYVAHHIRALVTFAEFAWPQSRQTSGLSAKLNTTVK